MRTNRRAREANKNGRTTGGRRPILAPTMSRVSVLPAVSHRKVAGFVGRRKCLACVIHTIGVGDCLGSLVDLTKLLSRFGVYVATTRSIGGSITRLVHGCIGNLRSTKGCSRLAGRIVRVGLSTRVFSIFNRGVRDSGQVSVFATSRSSLSHRLEMTSTGVNKYNFRLTCKHGCVSFSGPGTFGISYVLFTFSDRYVTRLGGCTRGGFRRLGSRCHGCVITGPRGYRGRCDSVITGNSRVDGRGFALPRAVDTGIRTSKVGCASRLFTGTSKVTGVGLGN